jgi:hypothetical protein
VSTPTPELFQAFDQLEGLDIADKATLVAKPFGITAVRFRTNDREVVFAEAEVVTVDGELCAISDSSTGIKDQLTGYLLSKSLMTEGAGLPAEWVDVKLFVPRGLRVSVYDVQVGSQTKPAKTYYLTTSGRSKPEPEPAAPARGKPVRS